MPNFFSTQATALNASPPVRIKVNLLNGRIRYAFGQFANPASNGALIADIIYMVRIPRGGRILGHMSQLSWGTGAASCTLNAGDNVAPTRHMAATSIASAGVALLQGVTWSTGVIGYEVTDESRDGTGVASATNDGDIRHTVAGANVLASQLIALHLPYVHD